MIIILSFRTAMTHAMIHSRPPSYHSQMSEQVPASAEPPTPASSTAVAPVHTLTGSATTATDPTHSAINTVAITHPRQGSHNHSRDPSQLSNSSQNPAIAQQQNRNHVIVHQESSPQHHHVLSVTVPDFIAVNSDSAKSSPIKKASPKADLGALEDHCQLIHLNNTSKSKGRKGSSSTLLNSSRRKDSNLVTIVQTSTATPPGSVVDSSSSASSEVASVVPTAESTVSSVIVTVSGTLDQQQIRASPGEVEILAHL